jgi:hypothetical protein
MTETISETNKRIIAEAFTEAFSEDTKTELHRRLFEKYITTQTNANEPQNNSSEFQKLQEHSQDFRIFAKERIEREFAQRQNEADNQQNQEIISDGVR